MRWALARSKEKAQQTLGDIAARSVVGDIRKVAEFAPCLKGVDVVFHTAAYFREYYAPGGVGTLAVQVASRLVQTLPAYVVREIWNWCDRSVRITSLITHERISPRADNVTMWCSTAL